MFWSQYGISSRKLELVTASLLFETLYNFSDNFMTQLSNTRFRINKMPSVRTLLAYWSGSKQNKSAYI